MSAVIMMGQVVLVYSTLACRQNFTTWRLSFYFALYQSFPKIGYTLIKYKWVILWEIYSQNFSFDEIFFCLLTTQDQKIKMAGSIREMSSEMGDNHGNFDLFRLDSSVRGKTRKCAELT